MQIFDNFKFSFLSQSVLVALCTIAYSHSLGGTFVFDDVIAVQKNPDVNAYPVNLSRLFSNDFWGTNLSDPTSHKSYRPLTILMFNMEYSYLDLRSFHMKLINLILHCVNTCLVCKIFKSILAAALFAVHPVHAEAVCGVVGRAELMFCLSLLLSLWLIDSASRNRRQDSNSRAASKVLAIALLSMTAIFFKETAITIMPICIFYDFINTERYKKPISIQIRSLFRPRNWILIGVTVLSLVFRLWIQNFESPKFKAMDNPIAAHDSFFTRLLSQNFIYALSLWILLCPQWLCFDWALGCVDLVHSLADFRMQGIVLMYSYACALLISGDRMLLLGFALLVIPFLPASGILKVGFVIAERTLYVPSIGYCLIVAHSFALLLNKYSFKWKTVISILYIFILMCFLIRARQRAAEWMTEEKLFSSALIVCPKNAKVHYNIARLATDKGERDKALWHYHKAIELYPEYEAALMNLGNLYREKGNLETAEKFIRKALDVFEEFPAAWMNLGIVQASHKKYDDALYSYQKALKYRKNYPVCYYNMGNLFLETQKYPEAITHWQQALTLNPKQPKAWANILTLFDSHELYEDGLKLSEQALRHLPRDTTIMFIRANILGKLKRYIEAEALYKRVIELEPFNAIYHTNLGVLYHRWNKLSPAIDCYNTAIRLNPTTKTAQENLRKLLKRKDMERTMRTSTNN